MADVTTGCLRECIKHNKYLARVTLCRTTRKNDMIIYKVTNVYSITACKDSFFEFGPCQQLITEECNAQLN